MFKQAISVTRVINSCVPLEPDGHAVLTGPWLTERWFLRRGEPRPLLGQPLVVGPAQAVAGASALGAKALVPVHDVHGHDPLSAPFRTTGTAADAIALAGPDLTVVDLPTGERREPAR
ncbi:hypothetical protein [Microbispora sp. NPDC049633]|uniref:hypothetical protein n=1 Tax=Microbispora sp. NPDC049633 TaxID=3154355 RepID=UPI00343A2B2C